MKYEDYPDFDKESNEWMNAPGGDPDPLETQYRNELLAIMWRWSQESDLTVGQWFRVTQESVAKVLFR